MRTVFALFIVLLGFGAMTQTTKFVEAGLESGNLQLAAFQPSGVKGGSESILIVDRNDDPPELLPCTEVSGDCSLRRAMRIANTDETPTMIAFGDHFVITLSAPLPVLSEDQTVIVARPGQEVHVNGDGTAGSVFYVTGDRITIEGLRLYGSGEGYAIIAVTDGASQTTIANNLIGDDDFPEGNCGQSPLSFGGIYIKAKPETSAVPAWVVGNTIECLTGKPGAGITIAADRVVIGEDSQGHSALEQRNTIRWNQGYGIQMGDNSGTTIRNTLIHNNGAGALHVTNFNNNIMDNVIR